MSAGVDEDTGEFYDTAERLEQNSWECAGLGFLQGFCRSSHQLRCQGPVSSQDPSACTQLAGGSCQALQSPRRSLVPDAPRVSWHG